MSFSEWEYHHNCRKLKMGDMDAYYRLSNDYRDAMLELAYIRDCFDKFEKDKVSGFDTGSINVRDFSDLVTSFLQQKRWKLKGEPLMKL